MNLAIQALDSIKHMVKTYIHYNIVYNSSLHHAIHALNSIAHMENQKNMESHSNRNLHDENPYTKNMESHLHRNVHDENPFKKKW